MVRGNSSTLVIEILSDSKGVTKGFDEAGAASDRFGSKLSSLAVPAGIAAAAIAGIAIAGVKAASDLEQSTGAVEAVFGEFADGVKGSAKDAADSVGLSANEYQNLAAIIGSQLKNAGTSFDQLGSQTDDLIRLGSDLAAVYGGSVSDAVSAVSSLMRGERDPIERYGVTINQAAINAYKAAHGLDDLTGAAKSQADAQAALALLYEQTTSAQGQFEAQSGTLAEQQQILNAKWTDAQAALGEALLPLLTIAAELLGDLAKWATENQTAFQVLVGVLFAAAAAVWALNIAMAANPIGLIIIAIAALIAIIVLLVSNWDQVVAAFKNGADQIAGWLAEIGDWFADLWRGITDGWNAVVDAFANGLQQIIDGVKAAIDWLGQLFGAQNQARSNQGGLFAAPTVQRATMTAAAAPSPAPLGFTVPAAAGGMLTRIARTGVRDGGGDTYITVQGALDPNAVAKQIAKLTNTRNTRVGLAPAAGRRW